MFDDFNSTQLTPCTGAYHPVFHRFTLVTTTVPSTSRNMQQYFPLITNNNTAHSSTATYLHKLVQELQLVLSIEECNFFYKISS